MKLFPSFSPTVPPVDDWTGRRVAGVAGHGRRGGRAGGGDGGHRWNVVGPDCLCVGRQSGDDPRATVHQRAAEQRELEMSSCRVVRTFNHRRGVQASDGTANPRNCQQLGATQNGGSGKDLSISSIQWSGFSKSKFFFIFNCQIS